MQEAQEAACISQRSNWFAAMHEWILVHCVPGFLMLCVLCCMQEPPGGGMRPAAVITSYVLYAYSAELQLLARQALNTFAILQVQCGRFSCLAGCRLGRL